MTDEPAGTAAAPASRRSETGQGSWGAGFLALVPIPVVGLVLAAVAMLASYRAIYKRVNTVAARNARNAANWGLTVLTVLVALCVWVVVNFAVHGDDPDPPWAPLLPLAAGVALFVVHIVVTIGGTVIAARGRVFGSWVAIPYLRVVRTPDGE